jgi:hypothetical protein
MSGSLTYRKYTADSGVDYSIKVDESNANTIISGGGGVGGQLCPPRTANNPDLPRGLKKRYVLAYSADNPSIRRKFYIGDRSLLAALLLPGTRLSAEEYPGDDDTAGVVNQWVVTAYRGEKVPIIPAFSAPDTGLTDGTALQ